MSDAVFDRTVERSAEVERWVVIVVSPFVDNLELRGEVDFAGVATLDSVTEVVGCEGWTEASVPCVFGPEGGADGCIFDTLLVTVAAGLH